MQPCKKCGNMPVVAYDRSPLTGLWYAICRCKHCFYLTKEAARLTKNEAIEKAVEYWDEAQE